MQAMIVWTWRLWLSEIWEALTGHDHVNLGGMIERDPRSSWRSRLIEIGGVRGGGQSGGGTLGGRRNSSWDSIYWLTRNNCNAVSWVLQGLPRYRRQGGSRRQSIVGWCSTRCKQFSLCSVLGVWSTRCIHYSVYEVLGVYSTPCMKYLV